MIIECKSCSKKFFVEDDDIPTDGRTVQCGNCSEQWFQIPTSTPVAAVESNTDEGLSVEELEASDGKSYRFLGMRWAEILPSGKSGRIAKKRIATELNQLAGKEVPKTVRKIDKRVNYRKKKTKIDSDTKVIDPSAGQTDTDITKKEKQGLGFFGYIFLLIIISLATIGVLITFQDELLMYFPEAEYIFDKGEFIFETMDNIITIIKDLIISY